MVGALDAFVDGGERVVDLAEVNGRVFVNNVSLGLYAEAVQQEGYRDAKIRTILHTVPDVLGPHGRPLDLQWTDQDGAAHDSAATILVSNNRYRLGRLIGSGTRPRLDGHVLGVAAVQRAGARRWNGRGRSSRSIPTARSPRESTARPSSSPRPFALPPAPPRCACGSRGPTRARRRRPPSPARCSPASRGSRPWPCTGRHPNRTMRADAALGEGRLEQRVSGANMDLIELKEKATLSREDAAARLHEIADELASGNDIVMERDRLRFVAHVPDEVHLKIEFEIEDSGSEFEIELTW